MVCPPQPDTAPGAASPLGTVFGVTLCFALLSHESVIRGFVAEPGYCLRPQYPRVPLELAAMAVSVWVCRRCARAKGRSAFWGCFGVLPLLGLLGVWLLTNRARNPRNTVRDGLVLAPFLLLIVPRLGVLCLALHQGASDRSPATASQTLHGTSDRVRVASHTLLGGSSVMSLGGDSEPPDAEEVCVSNYNLLSGTNYGYVNGNIFIQVTSLFSSSNYMHCGEHSAQRKAAWDRFVQGKGGMTW